MLLSQSLHNTLDRIFGLLSPKDCSMRNFLRSAPFAFVVMGSHAFALGQQPDAAPNSPAGERNVPALGANESMQDPFVAPEHTNPDAREENCVAPCADVPDPFAPQNSAHAKKPRDSRWTLLPLDFMYHGSYIPNVIGDQGRDSSVNDLFLDGTLNWAASESANLKARVLLKGEVQEAQSEASYHNNITGLEYFYQQRFGHQIQTLTIGRKYLGWSSGFQWRPADLIGNGFTTKNIEIQDPNRYLGVNQVRYQINQSGFNIDAVVSNRDNSFYDGNQSAVKLALSGPADFSLMYARNGDYSRKYGVILDTVLPWSTTMALEAVHIDIDRKLLFDSLHFGKTLQSLTGISRFEDVYLSLTKFIDDRRRVDLEYLYDGSGFKNASQQVLSAVAGKTNPSFQVDPSVFSNQYIGRYYAYLAYTGYVDGWKLQWKPSLLMNGVDHSYVGSISIEREFRGSSRLILALSSYNGDSGTEFGSVSHGLGVGVSYVVPVL